MKSVSSTRDGSALQEAISQRTFTSSHSGAATEPETYIYCLTRVQTSQVCSPSPLLSVRGRRENTYASTISRKVSLQLHFFPPLHPAKHMVGAQQMEPLWWCFPWIEIFAVLRAEGRKQSLIQRNQMPSWLGFPKAGPDIRTLESESEVAQSCPTLCDPVDCSPPGSSIHGIFQARLREWVAISAGGLCGSQEAGGENEGEVRQTDNRPWRRGWVPQAKGLHHWGNLEEAGQRSEAICPWLLTFTH